MSYSLRRYDHQIHKSGLLNLWKKVISTPTENRLDNLYTDYGLGLPETSLVFHESDDNPVGASSTYPCLFTYNNKEIKIGINCDMMMDKSHRTLGPAIMMLKNLITLAKEDKYQALIAMPNEKSQPVFKRIGYKHVGDAMRWSRIIKSKSKLAKFIKSEMLRNLLAPVVDIALRLNGYKLIIYLKYLPFLLKSEGTNLKLEELNIEYSNQGNYNLFKSYDYYRWRYSGIAAEDIKIFGLKIKSKLSGFIIYSQNEQEIIIHEIHTNNENETLHILMVKFIAEIYKTTASSISILYYGDQNITKLLKKLGFLQREGRGVFLRILDERLDDLKAEFSNFRLFDGELDL